MDYADSLAQLRAAEPELAAELAGFHTLEKLLGWFTARGLPVARLDLVAQDEYSHDLLIPLGDGGRWLSFAMT